MVFVAIIIGAAVGTVVVPATLSVAGFTGAGVAAGSVATFVQSAVYGGATSGVFATCMSWGAAGVPAAVQLTTGVLTGIAAAGYSGAGVAGVAAGSPAAVQSTVYGGAIRGVFATCMGGVAAAIPAAVTIGVTTIKATLFL